MTAGITLAFVSHGGWCAYNVYAPLHTQSFPPARGMSRDQWLPLLLVFLVMVRLSSTTKRIQFLSYKVMISNLRVLLRPLRNVHYRRPPNLLVYQQQRIQRGGGLGFFFACQYMKIPTDLDPKPPLRRILAQNPPLKNS